MNKYKTPILTGVFNVFGALAIVTPIILWFYYAGSGGRGGSADQFIYVFLVGIYVGLLNFGIAQIVDYIGRTAFTNEQIMRTLPSIVNALEKMDQRMAGSLPLRISPVETVECPEPVRAAAKPKQSPARYFCSMDGAQAGPFSAEKIRSMTRSRKINSDTPVIREGEEEWKTLADYPELS
jgi:hypothetical protein